MSSNHLVLIAALLLVAVCGSLIGFPFSASLGFTLALGLIFYLIQSSRKRKESGEDY